MLAQLPTELAQKKHWSEFKNDLHVSTHIIYKQTNKQISPIFDCVIPDRVSLAFQQHYLIHIGFFTRSRHFVESLETV